MKYYLGDGVYANFEMEMISLVKEDVAGFRHTIYLKEDVFNNLTRYAQRFFPSNPSGVKHG